MVTISEKEAIVRQNNGEEPPSVPTNFVEKAISKLFDKLFKKRSESLGELNGYVEEIISGQKTIKVYHQEQTMLNRFDERNIDAVNAYYNADYYGSMTGPSVNFINNLSLALICAFGSLLFLRGEVRLGDLSSFVQYSRKFSGPINEIANIIAELQSAFAAAERVFTLIDAEPEQAQKYPWLATYQKAGRRSLDAYLGTNNEIDFDEVSGIIARFKQGADTLYLKRMGRETTVLWYEEVNMRDKQVLIIEWTHGNSGFVEGVDIPILLNSNCCWMCCGSWRTR